MIRTLLKHEVLRTWRTIALVSLAALLVVATFTGIAMLLPGPADALFAGLAVVAAVIYLYAVPLLLALDFYRSCYSRTGYFTAASPAKGSTIFRAKVAHSYLVALLGTLFTLFLSLIANIALGATAGRSVSETMAQVGDLLDAFSRLPGWLIAATVALLLAYPLLALAPFFFAATVGSEAWINRSGFGGVVLTWFLFYLASQAAALAAMFIPPSLDLGAFPEVSWDFNPLALFSAGDNAAVLPVAMIVVVVALNFAAICWAQVSYSRRLELR